MKNRITVAASAVGIAAIIAAVVVTTINGQGNNSALADQTGYTPTVVTQVPDKGGSNGAHADSTCQDQPLPDPRPNKGTPVQMNASCNVKGDVEVADKQDGTYIPAHTSDGSGNILSCPDGCWIRADFGANISGRTVEDLGKEMFASGCTGGCKSVTLWVFQGGTLNHTVATVPSTGGDKGGTAASPTAAASAKPVNCDPSIKKGQTMLIPANCVVEGDVAVAVSEAGPYTKLYDNDQATGLVVVTKSDVWVKAPYGASASGVSPKDAFDDVFELGCGLDNGCSGGVDTVTVAVQNGQLAITRTGVQVK